jgi:hypothetical protein
MQDTAATHAFPGLVAGVKFTIEVSASSAGGITKRLEQSGQPDRRLSILFLNARAGSVPARLLLARDHSAMK